MAAVESRELVGAAVSFAHPNAPGPMGLIHEREQKAEQQLETSRTIEDVTTAKCDRHLTRDAASQKPASEFNKMRAQRASAIRSASSAQVRRHTLGANK